jgi:hypothetical protein
MSFVRTLGRRCDFEKVKKALADLTTFGFVPMRLQDS